MIASSLALALGVSVASAECTNSSGAIGICINGGAESSSTLGITWNGLNGETNIYQPLGSGSTTIQTLTFKYGASNATSSSTQTFGFNSSVEVNGNGNSLQIGDSREGKIEFRLASGSGNTATLDLSNITTSSNYALYGNLFVGGSGSSNTFVGTFGGKGIKGNIELDASAGVISTLNFTGSESEITGNITVSGANGDNTLTFSGSATIGGTVYVSGGVLKLLFDNGAAINSDVTTKGVYTKTTNSTIIVKQGETSIKGNILLENKVTETGSFNRLILAGTSATLGEIGKEISIKIDNSASKGYRSYGDNSIAFETNTNTLYLSDLSVSGDFGTSFNPVPQTFNALSFNGISDEGEKYITSISANLGSNIIGKDLLSQSDDSGISYNTALFGDSAGTPIIQSGFVTEFIKSAHSANGTFVFGDNSESVKDAIVTGKSGTNYININGTTIINGNILSDGSNNGNGTGHNNLIILSGTSATLGESGKEISIKITNASNNGLGYSRSSNNTLLFGANTNTLYLSNLSVSGDFTVRTDPVPLTFNALSFNNASDDGEKYITSISASLGSNIIGKDLITQEGGYNTALFGSGTPSIQSEFVTEFIKSEYTVKGIFNIGTITAENGVVISGGNTTTSNVGANYLNVETLNISGGITADRGFNIIRIGTGTITGAINAQAQGSGNKYAGNLLIFDGNATLNTSASIEINNTGVGYVKKVYNALSFNGATNNLELKKLYINGDFSNNNPNNRTQLNILSFNENTKTNTVSIESTQVQYGTNIVGKNLIQDSEFDTTLFDDNSTLKDNIATTFMTDAYTAQGIFTFGINSSDVITANSGGTNYINVEKLISKNISASGGNNYIYTHNASINGTIISSGAGMNTITALDGTAVITGISTQDYNASNSGNIINLGDGSITINTRSGDNNTEINDKALYAKNGNNSNSITANTIVVNGEIYANSQAVNSLTASSSITVTGDIGGGATNNFTLTANNATLTLNGKAIDGTSHDITSLTATTTGTNTLTLDNSSVTSGAMTTTITSVTGGENLAVVLKSKGTSEGVSLSFTNATSLKSVMLAGATGNVITFNAGANNVAEKINVGDTQDLTLNLAGATTSLNLAEGLSGGAISVSTTNGVLSGGAINGASLSFANSKALTLQNTSAIFTSADTSAGSATLTLDGTSNAVNTTISSLKGGNNLAVTFNGRGENNGATLKINSIDSGEALTLASVSMGTNSTNNTLDLSNLADSVTSVNSASAITVGSTVDNGGSDSREGLGIKVKGLDSSEGRTITFTGGLTTTNGVSTLTILDGNATLSATANGINLTNLDISAKGISSTVTFLSDTTIGTLTAQADGGNNLVVGNASDKAGEGSKPAYSLTINTTNSTFDSVTLEGGDTTTLTINGGTQTINTLTLNASANSLILTNKDDLTIGKIEDQSMPFNVTLNDSTLSLAGDVNKIDSLTTNGNALINLAVGHNGTNKTKSAEPKLTIGNLNGDLSANIFVSKTQADQIIINDATNASGNADTLTLYARGNAGEIVSITREDNILVANTSGAVTTNRKNIEVIGGISDLGGLVIQLNVKEDTEGSGLWYVGESIVKGVDTSFQEVANTALAVNYDLYLANFNSLNKRMGELRDNPYNQGVWARVFGGAMSSDFGSGSKTNYITAQAGYDYSLTLGDARNYMGIALAYGSSWTKANEGVGLSSATLDNINSKMVEVGIYNSYVMDIGWYNDTILKFDYIMSDFDISASGNTSSHSTNNFAMVLSNEFGYRYKFAENEKGNWYIDPQLEVAFGYFNQSDFNQAIAGGFTTVNASQDAILTLRSRVGASLGKKFKSARGFATLYVGAFYEYDYIEGGNAQAQTLGISNTLDNLESNGRAIINVGSNIELTDGVRMYIDVEKSFGDKQRTDMQFNFGARYSFGEKNPTISYQEQGKKRVVPLKVEEKQKASANMQEATQEQEAKN